MADLGKKVIPRVRFDVDENDNVTGVSAISIVDKPAIESDLIAFGKRSKNDAGKVRYQKAKERMDKIQKRI
jgi:hypothetical protein